MANNYFGGYNQPMYNQPMQPIQRQADILAVPVQGAQAAQNYLVGAGNTVILTDFASGFIWLKSTDANGLFSTLRTFKVQEITPQQQPDANFIQRSEFEQFQQNTNAQLQQILNYLNAGGKQNESVTANKQSADVTKV